MSVQDLLEAELARFDTDHPRSRSLAEQARASLLGGVPMHWMVRWAGGFPVFATEAHGARFRDVDGLEYVDFCLGDTGAMTGHSPEPTVRVFGQLLGGSEAAFREALAPLTALPGATPTRSSASHRASPRSIAS